MRIGRLVAGNFEYLDVTFYSCGDHVLLNLHQWTLVLEDLDHRLTLVFKHFVFYVYLRTYNLLLRSIAHTVVCASNDILFRDIYFVWRWTIAQISIIFLSYRTFSRGTLNRRFKARMADRDGSTRRFLVCKWANLAANGLFPSHSGNFSRVFSPNSHNLLSTYEETLTAGLGLLNILKAWSLVPIQFLLRLVQNVLRKFTRGYLKSNGGVLVRLVYIFVYSAKSQVWFDETALLTSPFVSAIWIITSLTFLTALALWWCLSSSLPWPRRACVAGAETRRQWHGSIPLPSDSAHSAASRMFSRLAYRRSGNLSASLSFLASLTALLRREFFH